ncbi:MAG: helix-turn-helix transcriptional regulator [Slackia isoflavoniconvertens]|nr:helix-turn-helix transcriptional regulator [Slackia isoflavoniconvertens]
MIAVAVVSLVLSILPHSVLKGTFASHAPACVVVAYPLVTALFYLIMLGFLPTSMVVARLLGAISGVLFVPCSIVLARALSPWPLESALVTVCIAAGSSALLNWFSTYLSAIPLAVLYILLLGTIAVLYFTEPSKCSCDISFPAESCGSFLEIVTRFASVMAPALIGLSMFAFFMGVSRPNITENTSADVVGMLLAAVTLAMILAAFAVFEPLTDCVVRALLSIGMYYFFGVAALFAVAFAIAGSSAREFSPTLVLSVVMGCFSLSTMAGIAFGGHLHLPESQTVFIPVVVVAIYCVFLVAYSIVGFWRNTSSCSDSEEDTVDSVEPTSIAARCESLSEEFALSPRESEILGFLARGHTASFIAKTLIISESTVYTHTRNIYQKMGIGSREELLCLIERDE